MPKAFISYARDGGHGEHLAIEIQQQLQAAGFAVFRDVTGLVGGDSWFQRLDQELESSQVMVVVLSAKARASTWVASEVDLAREVGIPIIPVLAEKMVRPIWIRHLQALDFSRKGDYPALFQSIRTQLSNAGKSLPQESVPAVETTHVSSADNSVIAQVLPPHATNRWIKVGAQGEELPATESEWQGIVDTCRGLMWEAKTNDRGLHDYRWLYAYSGSKGHKREDIIKNYSVPAYVRAVNKGKGWCGYHDWRIPGKEELLSLLDKSFATPKIDLAAFPYTEAASFWWLSSEADTDAKGFVNFNNGEVKVGSLAHIRLVRQWDGLGKPVSDSSFSKPEPVEEKAAAIGRYIIHDNGTVTDTKTGLMWKRCSEGQKSEGCSAGKSTRYTWDKAMSKFAAGVNFAGYNDWRLPTIGELRTLVDRQQGPTINLQVFPNTPSEWFWSKSLHRGYGDGARGINFYNGDDAWYGKGSYGHVRLVRSGQ